MDVVFHRERGHAYHSIATRPDGVVVRLKGGSYNAFDPPLPHDIAHLVVEDELGLDRGLWGVIAEGGLFPQTTVVSGRRRPHATERARAIVKASHEPLGQAELLVGAICQIAHTGERPDPRFAARAGVVPGLEFERAVARLHAVAALWSAVPVGGTLTLEFGRVRARRERGRRAVR